MSSDSSSVPSEVVPAVQVTDVRSASPEVHPLALWSLASTPSGEHYVLGLRTRAGQSMSLLLKGEDLISMAAAVLDDSDRRTPRESLQ